MNQSFDKLEDDSILHELLEYVNRKQEPEVVKYKNNTAILPTTGTIQNALRYLNQRCALPESISQQISITLPWKFAVGDNGRLLAILQENIIEIRKSKDEYSSVIGRASVPKDAFPQWRKIVWSPDASFLVLASSNEAGDAVCSLIFVKPVIKTERWAYEFILVTYGGLLKSYHVSGTSGFIENYEFSFSNFYRNGVNAVVYDEKHNLFYVAGNGIAQKKISPACENGLTSWRYLNDYPYLKLSCSSEEESTTKSKFLLWNLIPSIRPQAESLMFNIKVSPNAEVLACLNTDSSIMLWSLPNLRLLKKWRLHDQPDYNVCNPMRYTKYKKFPPGISEFHPMDIGWWSNNSLIIARYSGSVSVCSVKDLRNLLGTTPEFLAGQPQISELAPGRGFLSLDCEAYLTSKKWNRDPNSEGQGSEASSDSEKDDEPEPITILNYASGLLQSTLYSITDIERFQPKRKKSKVLYRTYRVSGLKSTTPEELYSRKIDIEEYEEALALANTYNLDTDLVYQTQWRKSEFSLNAIQEHLSKVSKRSWVLNECITRVPDTLEAARELLNFGLKGANLSTLLAIGVKDIGKFIPEEVDDDWEGLSGHDLSLRQIQKENEILGKIDLEKLTESQKDLIKYRRKLLDLLDKLQTYEIILKSPETYDKSFYEEFRQLTAVENAVRFAKDSNYEGVEVMFTYHGEKLMPHWLAIINFFPETLSPSTYEKLLPECDSEGELFLFDQRELRQKDWSEKGALNKIFEQINSDGSQFIYDLDPSLCIYRNTHFTRELLQRWYTSRAYQIERNCCMVDNALELVRIGKSRNIPGLENLLLDLETLDDLVYKIRLEKMSLTQLEKLSDLEKITLFMSTSDETNFVANIKNSVLSFLRRKHKYGDGNCDKYLLGKYLISLSKDNLNLPLKFFEYLERFQDPDVMEAIDDAVTLALDCLYTSTDLDMYEQASEILRIVETQFFVKPPNTEFDPVDEAEKELRCIEILRNYNVKVTLNYVRENKKDPESVKMLLTQMARSLNKKVTPPDENFWAQLLNDMLEIHELVFSCLDIEICFEICVSARLVSGIKTNIQNCTNLIETKKNEQSLLKVTYERAVHLILDASREYFNSSKSLTDSNMELAKACLHLITDDNVQVTEEYELISSLQILKEFNVDILPLQVRLCQDRLKLIESCLNSSTDGYKSRHRLITLANYLRIDKNNTWSRQGKVLELIAQKSFQVKDYITCASTCQLLMDANFFPAWKTVLSLAYCEEYEELKFRQKCMCFVMSSGPNEILEDILKQWHLIEIQILSASLQDWMPSSEGESFDNETESDDEFIDAVTTPQIEVKEFAPTVLETSTGIVKNSAQRVKESTFGVIKNVSNRQFWKSAIRSYLTESTNTYNDSEDDIPIMETEKLQSFPAFYESLHKCCAVSNLDVQYTKYSMQDINSTKLKLCQILLRITALTETASYGSETSDINHLLLQCAQYTIQEDCLLGMSYLFSVCNDRISSVQTIFNSLPQTNLYFQLAAYFYSLELYRKLHPDCNNIYLYDPNELINAMMEVSVTSSERQIQEALIYWKAQIHNFSHSETDNIQSQHVSNMEIMQENPENQRTNLNEDGVVVINNGISDAAEVVDDNKVSISLDHSKSEELLTISKQNEDDWGDDWGDFSDHSENENEQEVKHFEQSNLSLKENYSLKLNGLSEEERFETFQKLFSEMKTKEQYIDIKKILFQWPKFSDPKFTLLENHPILRLANAMPTYITKQNTSNYELQILQEYKDLLSGQSIPREVFEEFLKKGEDYRPAEHNLYLKLCRDESYFHEEAVNIIKEKHQSLKLLPPILRELFMKNMTVLFGPNHPVYNQILEEVLVDQDLTEIEPNIRLLISKLMEQKNVPYAAALLVHLEGIPSSLATYDNCLQLLLKK
ncbi:neuroblastoma-amplified sequence isoform X2 [Orussus abietinus]|uniref:neuroblastoma-amplified sequence isoform X2 n=1 Tax=Orussus abietinus TaxID=222816 RepID=UPI0006260097|nr:neuroblastoma-amplified sequence isoform X2 [Orussus abietinus]